jgi:hypothetical protein
MASFKDFSQLDNNQPTMPSSLSEFEDNLLLLSTLSVQCIVVLAAYALVDYDFFLSIAELRRRKRRIPRCALMNPHYSSFQVLLASCNDQAYITVTGLDVATFHHFLVRFERLYKRYSPYIVDGKIDPLHHQQGTRGGRPRSLDAAGCEHTRILGALVEHPQGNLEEIQQENPAEHPRGTCRPAGPQGLDIRHRALRSQPRTASMDAGGAIRTLVPVTSPPSPPPARANVPTYNSCGKSRP